MDQRHRDQYTIIFRKKENNKATLYADARIDARDGTLLSFSQENPSAPDIKAPTKAVAKEVAEEFLTTMLGSQKQQYRLESIEVHPDQKIQLFFINAMYTIFQ
ncbi:YcdB/YcdC domain-containing protein [Brevibacillus laterosporus]